MLRRVFVVLGIVTASVIAACGDSSGTGTTASAGDAGAEADAPYQGPVECVASYKCHQGGCETSIAHTGCQECGTGETDDRDCKVDGGRQCTDECLRAITCRKGGCSGEITSTGCCSCLPSEIDDIACSADAATDG